MPLNDKIAIRTAADELLDLVKKNKRISVEEAAKDMKMPLETTQALVDFLVEERIFGIEYKFTTPYIYLYKEGVGQAKAKGKSFAKQIVTKEEFYKKAKAKKVPYERIEGLWKRYLQQNLTNLKEEFFRKAKDRKIPLGKIDGLWKKYLSYL